MAAMLFQQNGSSLWYATSDAPAPQGVIPATVNGRATGFALTVGVRPIGARTSVEVRYRLNGRAALKIQAVLARTDLRANAQYFIASLPEFRVGDNIEYIAIASWPGGQVPAGSEAATYPSTFKIVAAQK